MENRRICGLLCVFAAVVCFLVTCYHCCLTENESVFLATSAGSHYLTEEELEVNPGDSCTQRMIGIQGTSVVQNLFRATESHRTYGKIVLLYLWSVLLLAAVSDFSDIIRRQPSGLSKTQITILEYIHRKDGKK